MRQRLFGGALWGNPDFLKLWAGQTISRFGSQVSQLALPTLAIIGLHANALQVGILATLEFLPFPLLGLVAGVYSDRVRRRPLMIACDVGRALLLGTIPAAAGLGVLGLAQLYVVAFATGVLTVFFDVSYQSCLPALVERSELVEGNSKLEVTNSSAQVAGPAFAGFLLQAVGAALAVTADAVSFLVSSASLALIRRPEPAKEAPEPGLGIETGFLAELREGVGVVLRNPVLRRIAGCTATSNLGTSMFFAVELIFAYKVLHLSPGTVGLIFALGSVGSLLGALSTTWITARTGVGPSLVLTSTVGGLALFLTPLATLGAAFPLMVGTTFVGGFMVPVYNINQVSLRQAITPHRVQGRMNATMRTIVWGTMPLGSIVGGLMGTWWGPVPTLIAGACASSAAGLWILSPRILAIRTQPEPVAA
ncbi:MAG TPA: MFS transporter [Candidatus Dormibacteraeota bacterium]|nr:MFS transporter [Candidatus Dormibacteraeota bacterium]